MWCTTCRQEAPGVKAAIDASTAAMCCVRCGTISESPHAGACAQSSERDSAPEDEDNASWLPYPNPLAGFDSWEIEQKLLHIERVLSASRPENHSGAPSRAAPMEVGMAAESPVTAPQRAKSIGHWLLATLAWTALAAGVCGFSCGSVLAGCSLWSHRSDLWSLALPAMIVGQAFLLLGLLLQMNVFSRRHSQTAQQLSTVDAKIGSLAQRLQGPHSSSSVGATLGAANGENWRS